MLGDPDTLANATQAARGPPRGTTGRKPRGKGGSGFKLKTRFGEEPNGDNPQYHLTRRKRWRW